MVAALFRVKINPESCEAKRDVALAMVGEATLGDIASVEAMHFDKEGDRKELQEAARQALARTARAMACLSGVFSLKDIEPVMARLDPAARREVLASLQQNRQMHLEPLTLESGI